MAIDRREFLKKTGLASLSFPFFPLVGNKSSLFEYADLFFDISLAQWSLHRSYFGKSLDNGDDNMWKAFSVDPSSVLQGTLDPLNFPRTAREEFGIAAVEYVNVFYFDKVGTQSYVKELKKIADNEGVTNHLIMCDREGNLGDPDTNKRKKAVENHFKWVGMAKYLGCRSIRVNASSSGSYNDQIKYVSSGLRDLCEFCEPYKMNVLVENHGGLSSNGKWLRSVMELVDHPLIGTLPDFGNFTIRDGEKYDRYRGVKELIPYAKGVSAKSYDFGAEGNETTIDYTKMMEIVKDSGFNGYIGIEYEGNDMSEKEGIIATKKLLEKIGSELSE